MEGMICVLMAAPFALGLAALGGMLGYSIQKHQLGTNRSRQCCRLFLLLVPVSFGSSMPRLCRPPVFMVRTAV